MRARPANTVIAITLAGAITAGTGICLPARAAADEVSDLQERVEQTSAAYQKATKHVSEVQAKIDDNEAKIDDLESQLPDLRKNASRSIKSQYRMQQSSSGLVDIILSSDDFNEVVSALQYLDIVSTKNADAVTDLVSTEQDLKNARDDLNDQKAEAVSAQAAAKKSMDEAISARQEAQKQAQKELAAEQAEADEAVKDAEAEKGKSFKTASGNEAKVEVPSSKKSSNSKSSTTKKNNSSSSKKSGSGTTSNTSDVTWTARDKFVNKWAGRINAYLAGSPMAGHGKTFAEAAYDNGVDPRWSPAISCVESTKGAACFRPHNAWGWGNSSWGDWDSAIRAHVAGLASSYGYTLTPAAAKKYCPPNWQAWYSSVLAQMNSI